MSAWGKPNPPEATPAVLGMIRADGASHVTINGVTEATTPPGTGLMEARSAVTAYVASRATINGPVVVEVTEPELRVMLMVHPDGTVSYLSGQELTATASANGALVAPAAPVAVAPAAPTAADFSAIDDTRVAPLIPSDEVAPRRRRRDYAAAAAAAEKQPADLDVTLPSYSELAFAPPGQQPAPAEAIAVPDVVAEVPVPTTPAAAPVVEATAVEAPVVETPVVEAPVTAAPFAAAPTPDPPVAAEPVTVAPAVQAPFAQDPFAQPQTSQAPFSADPYAAAPFPAAPFPSAPFPTAPTAAAPMSPVPANAPVQAPSPAPPPEAPQGRASFLQANEHEAPASQGWRGAMQRVGINVAPSQGERDQRTDEAAVAQHWPGTRTVAVVNGKGGSGKTPTTAMLAAVFARQGGGGVLAWDNNETRGTLGWRTEQGSHASTVRDLLPRTDDLLAPSARAAEVSYYVHHQTQDKYDVLRSAPHLLSAHQRISGSDFDALHDVASKYFRLLLIDSGNDEAAEHWLRMIDHAHQIVVPLRAEDEHAEAAALLLEELGGRDERSAQLAARAVVVVSEARKDAATKAQTIANGFRAMVRSAVVIPYDPAMVGGLLHFDSLKPSTQRAWLKATAEVARGL